MSEQLRIENVTFDCGDVDRLVAFWTAALGYELQKTGSYYAAAVDPSGRGPRLFFQRVPEAKVAKNRVHLDLFATDRQAEVERLTHLGAREIETINEPAESWVVMADPEGNELCVTSA